MIDLDISIAREVGRWANMFDECQATYARLRILNRGPLANFHDKLGMDPRGVPALLIGDGEDEETVAGWREYERAFEWCNAGQFTDQLEILQSEMSEIEVALVAKAPATPADAIMLLAMFFEYLRDACDENARVHATCETNPEDWPGPIFPAATRALTFLARAVGVGAAEVSLR
jgi:hypothetical protein